MSRRSIAAAIIFSLPLTAPALRAEPATPAQIMRIKTCKRILLESSGISMECKGYDEKSAPAFCADDSPQRRAIDRRADQLRCKY